MIQLRRSLGLVVGVLAMAACTNTSPKEIPPVAAAAAPTAAQPTAAPVAAAVEQAKPPRSPAQATCDKYKDAVAHALAVEITRVVAQDIPRAPLRCIYQNAKLPAAIDFRPDGNLQASRKEMSTDGAHAFDSPALGKNAFRANFGGVNYVYGMKGTLMIKVGSGGWEYGPLEQLWQKVAAID
jgi:hypothetical protein